MVRVGCSVVVVIVLPNSSVVVMVKTGGGPVVCSGGGTGGKVTDGVGGGGKEAELPVVGPMPEPEGVVEEVVAAVPLLEMPVKVGLTVLSPLPLDTTVVVVTVLIMVVVMYEFVMKVVGPLLIVTTSPLPKMLLMTEADWKNWL